MVSAAKKAQEDAKNVEITGMCPGCLSHLKTFASGWDSRNTILARLLYQLPLAALAAEHSGTEQNPGQRTGRLGDGCPTQGTTCIGELAFAGHQAIGGHTRTGKYREGRIAA